MRTLYQRVLVTLMSTIVLAAAGGLGGYLLGHAYAIRQAESRLDQYANRILLETIASTSESRAMLATMNGSPYPLCSDAEIEYFRQLIFQSQFLKAAGRMHDGHIECSTTSGRNPLANTQYQPVMQRAKSICIGLDNEHWDDIELFIKPCADFMLEQIHQGALLVNLKDSNNYISLT